MDFYVGNDWPILVAVAIFFGGIVYLGIASKKKQNKSGGKPEGK